MKSSADATQLQRPQHNILWAFDVNMRFNREKFECIRYWPNQDLGSVFKAEFKYINESGNDVLDIKDLGVQFSNGLTFSKHIEKTISTCSKFIGWFMRTFKTRNVQVMMVIWNSLIQN